MTQIEYEQRLTELQPRLDQAAEIMQAVERDDDYLDADGFGRTWAEAVYAELDYLDRCRQESQN